MLAKALLVIWIGVGGTQTIAVDHFDTILYTDTSFHNWMPLDISKVTKIVTVSINDGAFVSPVNGVLYFDNFRLVRKR